MERGRIIAKGPRVLMMPYILDLEDGARRLE